MTDARTDEMTMSNDCQRKYKSDKNARTR